MPPLSLFYFGKKEKNIYLFSLRTLKGNEKNPKISNITDLLFRKSSIFQKGGLLDILNREKSLN